MIINNAGSQIIKNQLCKYFMRKKAKLDPKDAHKESYTKNFIRTKLHRALKQIKLQPSQPYCGLKMRFL